MLTLRKSEERHHVYRENQSTWMTFDHGNKADPLQGGFGSLKMLNEETLTQGKTFVLHMHQHKAMVILTYVEKGMVIYHGPLERSDMLETGDFHRVNVTHADEPSHFSAVLSGDTHVFQSGLTSDFNPSKPGGRKKLFTHEDRRGNLKLIASPDGRDFSLPVQQDVFMYSTFYELKVSKGLLGEIYLWETVTVRLDWRQLNQLSDGGKVAIGDRTISFSGDNISLVRTLISILNGLGA